MNKDWMKYLAIAGGAYLAYWYVTNYGPSGAVSAGHISYWDTWFGSATAPAPVQTGGPTSPGYPNQPPSPVTAQPGTQATLTQPSSTPAHTTAPVSTALRQQILNASTGNPAIQGGYAIPDVWSYYWQQITGRSISAQQLAQAFPPTSTGTGAPLNLDQFLTGLQGVGLSGVGHVVTVPQIPSIPSMSFGGSYRKPGMRGMGGAGGRGMGGTTIQ